MNPILRAETDPLATAFNIKELFSKLPLLISKNSGCPILKKVFSLIPEDTKGNILMQIW